MEAACHEGVGPPRGCREGSPATWLGAEATRHAAAAPATAELLPPELARSGAAERARAGEAHDFGARAQAFLEEWRRSMPGGDHSVLAAARDFGRGLPHDCVKFAVRRPCDGAPPLLLPPLKVPSCRFYRRYGYDRFLYVYFETRRTCVLVVPQTKWHEFLKCLDQKRKNLERTFCGKDRPGRELKLLPGWFVMHWQLDGQNRQSTALPDRVHVNVHVHLSLSILDKDLFRATRLSPFWHLGRYYELFWYHARDASSDHTRTDVIEANVEAVFFATAGGGLKATAVAEVRDLHFPLEPACSEGVSWAKYKDRFKLGFSGTRAACVLRPEEVSVVEDMVSDTHECLSDGWGEVSVELAKEVGQAMKRSPRALPLQFRHAGTKGVATVSKCELGRRLIQRKSQVKIQSPTTTSHELEVIQAIEPDEKKPAKFNKQLILVLESLSQTERLYRCLKLLKDREVQRYCDVVSQLAGSEDGSACWERTEDRDQPTTPTQSTEATSQSSEARRSPQRLLELLKLLPTEGPFKPQAKGDARDIQEWLRCGVQVGEDPHALDRLAGYLRERLHYRLQDCKFECPDSCRRVLAPDPTRTLGPRQAVLKKDGCFVKGPILVARSPCQLPSDVQIFEGVDGSHIEETHQVDGLLFLSSHPSCPRCPAQLLAGGDYDGDEAFVSWWDELVQDIKCEPDDKQFTDMAPKMPAAPRSVGAVTNCSHSHLQGVLEEECAAAATNPEKGTLGCLTNWWEKAAEWEGAKSRVAVELALLCREAVDAPKTGWRCGNVQRYRDMLAHHSLEDGDLNPHSVRGRLAEELPADMERFNRAVLQYQPPSRLEVDREMREEMYQLHRRAAQTRGTSAAGEEREVGQVYCRLLAGHRAKQLFRELWWRHSSPLLKHIAVGAVADGLGRRASELAERCLRDLLARDHTAGELVMVPALALRWTHDEINKHMTFKQAFDRDDARGEVSVYAFVRDLLAKWRCRSVIELVAPVDLDEPLDVCVFGGKLWSLSNRRLAAVMIYQSLVPYKEVRVECRLCSALSWRFYGACQTTSGGLGVAPFAGQSLHLGVPLFGKGTAGSQEELRPSSEEQWWTVPRVGRATASPPRLGGPSAFGDWPPACADPVQLRRLPGAEFRGAEFCAQPGAEFRAEVLVLHVPIRFSSPPEMEPASAGPSPLCLLDAALRRGRADVEFGPADVCWDPSINRLCAATLEAASKIAAAHMFHALHRHEEVTLLCRWRPAARPQSLAAEAVALHYSRPLFQPEGMADDRTREPKRRRVAEAP